MSNPPGRPSPSKQRHAGDYPIARTPQAYLDDGDQRLYRGDCVDVMPMLGPVDAIVTDPPYGLGFMGKDWDSPGGTGDFPMRRTTEANTVNTGVTRQGGRQRSCADFARRQARDARSYQEWCETWASVALGVLKPGGHILAFGGTRTYHRLTCALEDAGFEIRDCLMWLYGSGFPKSLDVSKAIDKAAGAEREVVGTRSSYRPEANKLRDPEGFQDRSSGTITAPSTPDAERWQGWGTALKPAWEPIILARKPLIGTVAANVARDGTGALNIDACRIGTPDSKRAPGSRSYAPGTLAGGANGSGVLQPASHDGLGRWPANVVLDETAASILDEQSGEQKDGVSGAQSRGFRTEYVGGKPKVWEQSVAMGYGGGGGASRFFYTAKSSRSERNGGIHDLPSQPSGLMEDDDYSWRRETERGRQPRNTRNANHHPTVKPVALMRWLIRLITPPGGVVLDPFVGSGSTLVAARAEGFRGIGVDRELDYLKIAAGRLSQQSLLGGSA